MPAFENADAAFTACAPFLKFLEPTLLLSLLSGGALGVMAGNRYPDDPHLLGLGFVSGGKESGIRRHSLRSVSELFDMLGIPDRSGRNYTRIARDSTSGRFASVV